MLTLNHPWQSWVYCGDTDKDSGALFALAIREPGVLRHITGKQGPLDQHHPSTLHYHRVSHLGWVRAGYLRERDSLDPWWVEIGTEYARSRSVQLRLFA